MIESIAILTFGFGVGGVMLWGVYKSRQYRKRSLTKVD